MTIAEGQKEHRLILIGPQGSGKGTQAELLQVFLQIPIISTGQLCRAEIEKKTSLGEKIAAQVRGGVLVPDEIILNMVKARVDSYDAQNGFILDGFPRTVSQAATAAGWLNPTRVIVLEINNKLAVARMSSRRACSFCRYKTTAEHVVVYGTVCPRCGATIIQRDDDQPDAIKSRLAAYEEQTRPVIEFYKNKGIVERLNGALSIPLVFMEATHVL